MQSDLAISGLFEPHPNLSPAINRNIVEAELAGGVCLRRLRLGTRLEVRTKHNVYTIHWDSDEDAEIQGHPTFCPEPVRARIHGSTWGGSMIWSHFIGRGMHLEFVIPEVGRITTSAIVEIRELSPARAL